MAILNKATLGEWRHSDTLSKKAEEEEKGAQR